MINLENIIDNARFGLDNSVNRKFKEAAKDENFQKSLKAEVEKFQAAKDNRAKDRKLMDACIEMESLFVAKMFKEMRKTIHRSNWIHGGFAEDIFEDMLYDEYSLKISKNTNLGLARMLYDEMIRRK